MLLKRGEAIEQLGGHLAASQGEPTESTGRNFCKTEEGLKEKHAESFSLQCHKAFDFKIVNLSLNMHYDFTL